jgi:hypothetical protein
MGKGCPSFVEHSTMARRLPAGKAPEKAMQAVLAVASAALPGTLATLDIRGRRRLSHWLTVWLNKRQPYLMLD